MDEGKDFIIKFRGTRGSYPTPKADFLKYGGNTACVEVHCANQLIILDAGGGIIDVGADKIKSQTIAPTTRQTTQQTTSQTTIILSHLHQDHIQGLQFYKPLFIDSETINLFGLNKNNGNLKDTLETILFDKVFPLHLNEIKSDFNIYNFSSNEKIIIKSDGKTIKTTRPIENNPNDIMISSYKIDHPKDGCLCIKIEFQNKSLVYATDREKDDYDTGFVDFSKNCDCLIHDAQYSENDYYNPKKSKIGFGHSTFEMAIKTKEKTNAKKLFFFHYDPHYDDNMLNDFEKKYFKKDEILFAKENDEIKL